VAAARAARVPGARERVNPTVDSTPKQPLGGVAVRDFRAGRTVTVRAGQSYLARAIRATIKTRGG